MLQILSWVLALCAVGGGIDRLLGNKMGLGKPFEDGFRLLGPVALSMAGILCLAPVLAGWLGAAVTPVYHLFSQDPGMFGCILAIDMGGYPMAIRLADDPAVGRFAGIIGAAILGCTVSFTIPTGMGLFPGAVRERFARGILYGLTALPPTLLLGGVLCGLPLLQALWLCAPVLVFSVLLMLALKFRPERTVRAFSLFAAGLKILTTAGLALGAFQHMTGVILLPGMLPLADSMKTVAAIGIMMLGSLPLAELLRRVLQRPFRALGRRTGLGSDGVAGLLLMYLSVLPGLTALPELSPRGQTVNAAFAVSAASCLGAHLAFTLNAEPALALPLLAVKLAGGLLGALIAWGMTRRDPAGQAQDGSPCGAPSDAGHAAIR